MEATLVHCVIKKHSSAQVGVTGQAFKTSKSTAFHLYKA